MNETATTGATMTETPMEVLTRDIRVGDFLDQINPTLLYGPRGGKYRFDGVKVQSRVTSVGPDERGRFAIGTSSNPTFLMPGNSADMVFAQIRRSEVTEVTILSDDELLARSESTNRAERLAATAELDRRTR